MTHQEFMSLRGGYRQHNKTPDERLLVRNHTTSYLAADMPSDFDWRKENPKFVTPVKDQAFCGSCWAFALTSVSESHYAIQNQRVAVQLPEQFVVDCTWSSFDFGPDGKAGDGDFGCDGGESGHAALEIVQKFAGKFPAARSYGAALSVDGFCQPIAHMDIGAILTGWVDVPSGSDRALMDALYSQGPVAVGIMVPDEMTYYDSGIMNAPSGTCDPMKIDHLVAAVGFGVCDRHGTPYWQVRNSWSTYWGEQGYVRIAQGLHDQCVSFAAGYPLVARDAGVLVTFV
jgi:cathepsin L